MYLSSLCIVDVGRREFASAAVVNCLCCQSNALRPADVIDVPKHVAADATATKISAIKTGRYVDMEQTTVPKMFRFLCDKSEITHI